MAGPIDRLKDSFRRFPGIGIRQAERFVYHLLSRSPDERQELANLILSVSDGTRSCTRCYRFFEARKADMQICDLCMDETRDRSTLMVVEKDTDLRSMKRSGFSGLFFVLGGSIPILEKNPQERVRFQECLDRIKNDPHLQEVILALSATPQGDHTADVLRRELSGVVPRVSMLGRGLSTGTEIEYSDDETLQQALKHRE